MIESERWKIWWKASVLIAAHAPANPRRFRAFWYIAARDEKYIIYEYDVAKHIDSENDYRNNHFRSFSYFIAEYLSAINSSV